MTTSLKSRIYESLKYFAWTLVVPVQFLGIDIFLFSENKLFWPTIILIVDILAMIYIGFIAPYKIWQTLTGLKFADVKNKSLYWKIPTIIVFSILQYHSEILILKSWFVIDHHLNFILFLIILFVEFVMLRLVIYAVMLFIWQPNLISSLTQNNNTVKTYARQSAVWYISHIIGMILLIVFGIYSFIFISGFSMLLLDPNW